MECLIPGNPSFKFCVVCGYGGSVCVCVGGVYICCVELQDQTSFLLDHLLQIFLQVIGVQRNLGTVVGKTT